MINSLRKKFIAIFAAALAAVFIIITVILFILVSALTDRAADQLTDTISFNNGTFPVPPVPPANTSGTYRPPEMINPESPFSTRFFIVVADNEGNIESDNTDAIYSVTGETAREYAASILQKGAERGWIYSFRYKLNSLGDKQMIVFVDCSVQLSLGITFLLSAVGVLFAILLTVFLLAVLFSGKAVRPVAESYEKQKQFITDANHELKTPLTLILANIDILSEEIGDNEWLSDIRSEGERMSVLVNELVDLSRMDEGNTVFQPAEMNMTEILSDMVSEYEHPAAQHGISVISDIPDNIRYTGDESMIRHLFSILLDNAVKYCDKGGTITVKLEKKRHTTLYFENTFSEAANTQLDRLFDRFYRSDKARTAGNGYGIGLSLARSIAVKHKGSISAYCKDKEHIGFKVVLK